MECAMATSTLVKTLVVWDYDWSLINCNSDTFVVEQLRPDLYPKFREYVRRGTMVARACCSGSEGPPTFSKPAFSSPSSSSQVPERRASMDPDHGPYYGRYARRR